MLYILAAAIGAALGAAAGLATALLLHLRAAENERGTIPRLRAAAAMIRSNKKNALTRAAVSGSILAAMLCAISLRTPDTILLLRCAVTLTALLVAAGYDLVTREIPDGCTVLICLSGVIFSLSEPMNILYSLLYAVIAAAPLVIVVLLFNVIKKRESMGWGDIKLLFAVTFAHGVILSYLMLLFSCIFGLIFSAAVGIYHMVRSSKDEKADTERITEIIKQGGDITELHKPENDTDETDTDEDGDTFPFAPCIFAGAFAAMLFADLFGRFFGMLP